jgi:hypothetical protein
MTIAPSSNFSEPFEPKPAGFAHPRAQHELIAQTARRFVVDFVAQHHPADAFLRLRAGNGTPVRCGNFLDPPQVNGIVHMILLVYVFGQNCDSDFKNSRGHKGLQFISPLGAVILSEALQRNAKHEARLSKISGIG